MTIFERLGSFVHRRRWFVIGAWALVQTFFTGHVDWFRLLPMYALTVLASWAVLVPTKVGERKKGRGGAWPRMATRSICTPVSGTRPLCPSRFVAISCPGRTGRGFSARGDSEVPACAP